MEKTKGKIEVLKQNEKNYAILIDGNWYSNYKTCPFEKGDIVLIEWQFDKTNQYRNIKTIREATDEETFNIKPLGVSEDNKGLNKPILSVWEKQKDVRTGLALKVATTTLNAHLDRINSKESVTPSQIHNYAKELIEEVWPNPDIKK